MDKQQLINNRKIEICNSYPDYDSEQVEDFLLKWFTIEFLNGEITRQELDEYALLMGYTITTGEATQDDIDSLDSEEECKYA